MAVSSVSMTNYKMVFRITKTSKWSRTLPASPPKTLSIRQIRRGKTISMRIGWNSAGKMPRGLESPDLMQTI